MINVDRQQDTGKTVAIILGGAAGVGFLIICMLFARSLLKKHDGKCIRNNIYLCIIYFLVVVFIFFYFLCADY